MSDLLTMQKWLGALIAQPLRDNHLLPSLSPFGTDIEKEAAKYISPGKSLKSFQRVQIYHQQYWWRLLKCVQKNFPTLTRLFGYESFQSKLAIPYLSENPPEHWSLAKLGKSFPRWLEVNYIDEDSYLVITAAKIDWASEEAFFAKNLEKVNFSHLNEKDILTKELSLQPHIHLFALQGDFFSFREEFLKQEPEYYNTNPFPSMIYGEYYFVLYRTPKNVVTWEAISREEHWMLSHFKKSNTIERVCAELEKEGGEILEKAQQQIPFWFKQWTVLEWFGQS